MNEPVSGLSVQSSVRFNGVLIGYVKSIALNHEDPQQVRLLLAIEEGTPVTVSTSATLKSQGITGMSYIGLSASSGQDDLLKRAPDEPYPVIPAKPSLLLQLDTAIQNVSDDFKEISKAIKLALNPQNAKLLHQTISNIEVVSRTIAERSKTLDSIIADSKITMHNTAIASKTLPQTLKDLSEGIRQFKRLSHDMRHASQSVTEAMDTGKRTISSIKRSALPPAIEMMDNLSRLSQTSKQLMEELKKHPSMLVRGKSQARLGPGER